MTDSDLVELDFLSQSSIPLRKLLSEHAAMRAEVEEVSRRYRLITDIAEGIIGADPDTQVGTIKVHFDNRPSMWLQDALKAEIARLRGGEK